ncbi:hypothetical protein LZ32DRAFT_332293 [Colletotrichum eremochloae]|nr:hypothetical protein LZ32DRAFT_332293 [Colletotrichum eremochloae]
MVHDFKEGSWPSLTARGRPHLGTQSLFSTPITCPFSTNEIPNPHYPRPSLRSLQTMPQLANRVPLQAALKKAPWDGACRIRRHETHGIYKQATNREPHTTAGLLRSWQASRRLPASFRATSPCQGTAP